MRMLLAHELDAKEPTCKHKQALHQIQAQISASAAAKESSLRSAGITASSPFARKQQAALKLQLYSKQLMKVNEKLEQHHDWQSAEQALEKQARMHTDAK